MRIEHSVQRVGVEAHPRERKVLAAGERARELEALCPDDELPRRVLADAAPERPREDLAQGQRA